MKALLVALSLLLPALAVADVDPRFAKLRDSAEPLGGLGGFLTKYIGECSGFFVSPKCKGEAEKFRQHYQGKRMYMIVTEEVATMVAPGPYNPATRRYTLHVTPSFPGGDYLLTAGAPKKVDEGGHPVVPLLKMGGELPAEWTAQTFAQLFSKNRLRAQVIFTPNEVWTMPGPGGGTLYGVSVKVEAVLITEGRTGDELGLWLDGKEVPLRPKRQ